MSSTEKQLEILSNGIFADGRLPTFEKKINATLPQVASGSLAVLQINLGYMCNQVCAHCHVDAGPDRKEIMTQTTLEECLKVMKNNPFETVDLTGGAPEMHPNFRWFVEEIRKTDVKEIIVRSNLTIIVANKKYHDLPDFFAKHNVHVISSLPFYKREKTDRQRGSGVFNDSIDALQKLNKVGYGPRKQTRIGSSLQPLWCFLPGDQAAMENDFKAALKKILTSNSQLYITNLPISRFLDYLIASENYEEYMYALVEAYNPSAAENVMCRTTLSVRWDGYLRLRL